MTYTTSFLRFEICMHFLITSGEDRVCSRVHAHAGIPFRTGPLGAGGVHVADEVRVVGDYTIQSDS